ncbi:hypothetical protein [Streptomyces narbonensis]|uniref:hypothetical protein n=1 Tax=Streptomyces narbonensis TaxID=67333 RepID=UPI0033D019EF
MRITIEIEGVAEQPSFQEGPPPVPRPEAVAAVDMGPAPNPDAKATQPLASTGQGYATGPSATGAGQSAGSAPAV